ncbi:sugar-binding transcriptional regulator [Schaalia naturae]|uniref:Sugar-binding transcriptional regulator n=1 Tax=Schaalia naturae TaxID=635203 RepID=A0ABW2SIU5_9ACTO
MSEPTDDHLLLRVAQLHYEQGLNQQQVASRLSLSRWQVGRMLDRARTRGIVRIEIVHPEARSHKLEERLVAMFGIRDAVVVPGADTERGTWRLVAQAAGEYLADRGSELHTVAVSWGRTMGEIAHQIPVDWANRPTVVQANGGLSRPGPGAVAGVVGTMASRARGVPVFLPAPAIVKSRALASALRAEPVLKEVLKLAQSADALVFSLGPAARDSVLVSSGLLTADAIDDMVARGCVGDVLGRFLDSAGESVDDSLDARTIGLGLDDIRSSALAVAIAAGPRKSGVARAVASHGLCDVLVTDRQTAASLVDA